MGARGFRSLVVVLGALLTLGAAPPPKGTPPGKTLPKVVLKEVVDDRYGGGKTESGLVIALKVEGEDVESFPSGRALLKEARDDSGRSLLPKNPATPSFSKLKFSPLRLDLVAPPRSARSVTVSGSVELFAPEKDPAAVVKVPKALAQLDRPLVSPGLAAANLEVTVLSKARSAEEAKKQSSPEAVARLRQLLKAEGKSDEEVAQMLEMRDALSKLFAGGDAKPDVTLLLKAEDVGKIQDVTFLGPDGTDLRSGGVAGGSDGVMATRSYTLQNPPGPDTTIVFTLLTEKARVSVPFMLKDVPLP